MASSSRPTSSSPLDFTSAPKTYSFPPCLKNPKSVAEIRRYNTINWWKKTVWDILYDPDVSKLTPEARKKVKCFFIISRPYFQTKSGKLWTYGSAYEWFYLIEEPNKKNIRSVIYHLCEVNSYARPGEAVICSFKNFPPRPHESFVVFPVDPTNF
ncbi:hypothetical protein FNV43_RR04930 [Rhamnella rubrinervis]|uniref:Uncharacterized protein n=1 Tax=Rhamnella rubrinervis TaxID=2594499 RepID=A0A8K0HMX8_9ROSA|nr:hypothetical protein FNV43_RR04930 [Rhamnella rubrinervis]